MEVSARACWACFYLGLLGMALTIPALIFDWQPILHVVVPAMGLAWLALFALLFVDAQAPRG